MKAFLENLFHSRINGISLLDISSNNLSHLWKCTHTIIEVSNVCNYKCTMCNLFNDPVNNLRSNEKPGFMDFELFKKIIDDTIDYTTTICLQGRGEPMLHPKYLDLIKYVRSKSDDIVIWFNTNGALLSSEMARGLIKNRVTKVYFSLDAATKKTYESIRIGGKWEEVTKNLLQLAEMSKGGIHLGVSFVVQKKNRNEKYEFLRRFLPVVDEVVFYNLADKNRIRKKSFDINFNQRPPCPLLKEQKFITLEGKVAPCCGALSDCFIGDMKKESFREILDSERLREMVRNQEKGNFDDCRWCLNCTQWWGAYTVSLKTSPLKKFFEVGLANIEYNHAVGVTSEVYTKVK